jgi:protein-tyrosine phosphatase
LIFYLGTTIVCAYLMRFMNMTLRDAYLLCKKGRPICFPNLGFWNQLISYEYQLKKDNSVKSKFRFFFSFNFYS